ncbi:MAG: DNA repair protein RecO [Phycisphaerae bacterium]
MRHREASICLRTYDWSETSQVVCFLSRNQGLVRLLAKGSKRAKSKSGGTLDLLAEGDLVFTTKDQGLGTLIEFSESVTRKVLRRDPQRLYAALFCLEMVCQTLAEHDPHPEVFDLLHNALGRLDNPDSPIQAVLAYFQWRLLRNLGLLGDLDSCVSCGGPVQAGATAFTSRMGGLLCRTCRSEAAEQVAVDPETRSGLEILASAEAGRRSELAEKTAEKLIRLLAYHVSQQIGKPLKTARYVLRWPL